MAKYIIAQLQAELNKEPKLDRIAISRALVQLIIANLEVIDAPWSCLGADGRVRPH